MVTYEYMNKRSIVKEDIFDMQRCNQNIDIHPIGKDKAARVAEFLHVFADPGRVQILSLLIDREVCVSHIAKATGKSVSAVSHQLRVLRAQHVVRHVKDGKNTYYALDDDHVADVLRSGIDHIEHA